MALRARNVHLSTRFIKMQKVAFDIARKLQQESFRSRSRTGMHQSSDLFPLLLITAMDLMMHDNQKVPCEIYFYKMLEGANIIQQARYWTVWLKGLDQEKSRS